MTKSEFIAKLKAALENDLDSQGVQENVAYYSAYIEEELRKGRSESEVLEELGDPWVIAQSVIDMEESRISADSDRGSRGHRGEAYDGYGHGGSGGAQDYSGAGVHEFRVDTWWKRLLITLVVIGVIILIFMVVGGILSLVMPVLVPILVIILLVQMIRRLR